MLRYPEQSEARVSELPSCRPARRGRVLRCMALAWAAACSAPFAGAQTTGSSATAWSGVARCDIAVVGPGYSDRQSHVWALVASPPALQGAARVHAALWSVVGSGALTRTQGSQTLDAQWTTRVRALSAPIAFTVRASDGRLLIRPWHAQLRARGAIAGAQRLTVDGKAQRPVAIGLEAFEWSFPSLEIDATVTQASGTSTPPVTGRVSPMQPADARATASCSWQFVRSATATASSALTTSTGPSAGVQLGGAGSAGPITAAPGTAVSVPVQTLAYLPPPPTLWKQPGGAAAWGASAGAAPLIVNDSGAVATRPTVTLVFTLPDGTDVRFDIPASSMTPLECAAAQSDLAVAFGGIIQTIRNSYAQQLLAATTQKDRDALLKAEDDAIAAADIAYAKALAQLQKYCDGP